MEREDVPAGPRPATVLALAALLALALLGIWWYWTGGGARHQRPAAAGANGANTRPVAVAEISRFDRRVYDELHRTRPRITALRGAARLTVTAIHWKDARGRQFLDADGVTARVDLGALARGDFLISGVDARNPDLLLVKKAGDTLWNYERVLAAFLGGGAAGGQAAAPARTVLVQDLRIDGGKADIEIPDHAVRFLDIQAQLSRVALSGPALPEPQVALAQGGAVYASGDTLRFPFRLTNGLFTFPQDSTTFDVATLAFGQSRIEGLRGYYDPKLPGAGIRAVGGVPHLRLADLSAFLPGAAGQEGAASARFAASPTAAGGVRLAVEHVVFSAQQSDVTGSLTLDVGPQAVRLESADLRLTPLQLALVEQLTGTTLPYVGTLTGHLTGTNGRIAFEALAQLTREGKGPYTVNLEGQLTQRPEGFGLEGLTLNLKQLPLEAVRAVVPVPVQGNVSGRITLAGAGRRGPLRLDVRLDVGGGVALVNGTVTGTGRESAYDVSGRLIDVRLRDLLTNAPPAALTAQFSAQGHGLSPATATARVRADGRFTGWRTTADDRLVLAGQLDRGTLVLDTLLANLATLQVRAAGRWGFEAPGSGGIRYRAALSSLDPFAPYVPGPRGVAAAGAWAVDGTLSGTLERPQLGGTLAADSLRYADWSLAHTEGTYGLGLGGAVPSVQLDVTGRGFHTPTLGDFSTLRLQTQLTQPNLAVALHGARPGGGAVELTADGQIPAQGPRVITLRTFSADLAGKRWALQQPASVTSVPGGALDVQRLIIQQQAGEGRLSLSGRILPATDADFTLSTAALPLGDAFHLAGRTAPLTGDLWLTAQVQPPAAAPTLTGEFQMRNAAVEGVALSSLRGKLAYRDRRITGTVDIGIADGGSIHADADLPAALALGAPPKIALLDTGAAHGHLVADTVPLRILSSLLPQVTNVDGNLNASLSLAGTAQNPALSGSASLLGGVATVPAVQQRFDQITGTLSLQDRRVVIQDLRAHSGGWAVASGDIELKELNNPVANVKVSMDGFRPMHVQGQADAGAWGELRLAGAVHSPTLTGDIRLDDGTLVVPTGAQPGVLEGNLAAAPGAPALAGAPLASTPATPFAQALTIDGLKVTAGQNLWFATAQQEARVQLAGSLTVYKTGSEMRVFGTLSGQRGTFTLFAGPIIRRLDILQAEIRFLGGTELNPRLDVVAQKTVLDQQQRQVNILAHLTGTLESPQLSLSTGQGVQIPESELLSFLVFGQPSFELGNNQALLQQTVLPGLLGGAAQLLSLQLQQSLVGQSLGLDVLEIRPSAPGAVGGLGSSRLVAGVEPIPNVFLTLESAIGALFGNASTEAGAGGVFAVHLSWQANPATSLTLGYEPVNPGRALPGMFVTTLPGAVPVLQQVTVELRRRWTY